MVVAEKQLAALEAEITRDLEVIVKSLEQKYSHFIPVLISKQNEIYLQMDELSLKIQNKLSTINSFVEDANATANTSNLNKTNRQLDDLNECCEVVDKMSQIEQNLLQLYSSTNQDLLSDANLLVDCQELLKEIIQDDKNRAGILVERMREMMRSELSSISMRITYLLNDSFGKFLSYPECAVKGVTTMQISNTDSDCISKELSAMAKLNNLDGKLSKLSQFILQKFCQPVVDSRDGNDILEIEVVKPGVMVFKSRTHAADKVAKDNTKGPNVKSVLRSLVAFFTSIGEVLNDIEVNGRKFTLVIGGVMEEQLMTMILKGCMSMAASANDEPEFEQALGAAEDFRTEMIKLGFMNDATVTFRSFAEAHETLFIDRRCLSILQAAKQLIAKPYLQLVTVGHGVDMDKETVLGFVESFHKNQDKPTSAHLLNGEHGDDGYPKLLQLLECQVSQSTVELVDLVYKTLKTATQTDNEALCARLALTSRNVINMFVLLAPRLHQAAISSVPQIAAVFYNNCYYICHRIMMLPFDVLSEIKNDAAKYEHFRPLLLDYIWPLRELASQCLETTLTQIRREFSNTLGAESALFENLNDLQNMKTCNKVISKCILQAQTVATVWKDVLTETVYCMSLGNVVSFLLRSLSSMFLSAEDIRQHDAEAGAGILKNALAQLEKLFVVRGASCIREMCSKAFYQIVEIIFCLEASLQGISDRWCDGKGPLAEYMSANDVRKLIRALFSNSEQRKRLIDSIY